MITANDLMGATVTATEDLKEWSQVTATLKDGRKVTFDLWDYFEVK